MNITHLTPTQLRKAASIKEQIAKLEKELGKILGSSSVTTPTKAPKTMSASARARISAAAKARWAKIKGKSAKKAKRKMSAKAKARLSALAKARWAKAKKAGKTKL